MILLKVGDILVEGFTTFEITEINDKTITIKVRPEGHMEINAAKLIFYSNLPSYPYFCWERGGNPMQPEYVLYYERDCREALPIPHLRLVQSYVCKKKEDFDKVKQLQVEALDTLQDVINFVDKFIKQLQ